jgi:hypothetical protein
MWLLPLLPLPLPPLGRGGNLVAVPVVWRVAATVPVSNAVDEAATAAAAAAAVPTDEVEESNVLLVLVSLCMSRPPPLLLERA